MILLIGVAGAGKSMQGRILADEHGFAWISTGEILRVLVTGKRRQEMLQGKLMSDQEVITLLDKVLELIDTKQQFVLDAFPRTLPQAEWLWDEIAKGRFKLDCVIHLQASDDIVVKRLLNRGRPDDTADTVKNRIKLFNDVTAPILQYFRDKGIAVYDIDGDRDARVVHDEILNFIDNPTPLVERDADQS